MSDKSQVPMIRVGDTWIPAHRIWKVVESITTATDLVARFNEDHEPLTTPMTRDVVERVRARIRDMELSMGGSGSLHAAAAKAAALLGEELPVASGSTDVTAAEQRRGSTELESPAAEDKNSTTAQLAEAARQLLEAMPLEDALRMLEDDYKEPIDIRQLIAMVGHEVYLSTLSREAQELAANQIAADQVAVLWNESGFPSPVDGLWTTEDVQALLDD